MPHLLDIFIDKQHIPGRTGELEKSPAVDAKLDDELKDTLQQIKRGDVSLNFYILSTSCTLICSFNSYIACCHCAHKITLLLVAFLFKHHLIF